MKPPTFTKAEEPLEADAWVKAIEAKFSTFTLPCSEERKANFATLQLRGEALMWWEHFKSMQPAGHEVTWVDTTRNQALANAYIWLQYDCFGCIWNRLHRRLVVDRWLQLERCNNLRQP
jgi:hypothetical protein